LTSCLLMGDPIISVGVGSCPLPYAAGRPTGGGPATPRPLSGHKKRRASCPFFLVIGDFYFFLMLLLFPFS
jgi:hypothetical protein